MPSSRSTKISSGDASARRRRDGLGDLQCAAADDPDGDGVDDPVDDADRDRDGRIEFGFERQLLGRADGAEQHLGIAERLLHGGHRIALVDVERRQLVGERRGVGAEAADVALDERSQMVGDVVDREQREPGEFVGEHPQPHLVELDRPVGRRTCRCWPARARVPALPEGSGGRTRRTPGGRGCRPSSRRSSPSSPGAIILPSPAIICAIGSAAISAGRSSVPPSDVARSMNSGR